MNRRHKKLSQFASTAICGNDISSSVFYVSALSIVFAGQYAWITLLIVSAVLFFYRSIYGEVVGALPLNGGVYNALLNTTSKSTASFAAAFTILSYMTTAVISANEAIHYLHHLLPQIPVMTFSVILLMFFSLLVIIGISESSMVAIGIFIIHLTSLALLSTFIVCFLLQQGPDTLIDNWQTPLPEKNSIGNAIFWGFAASMLGVSGFESSANFVEEQKPGVFPKTLRNMWLIVSIINPLMVIFALSLFALPNLQSGQYLDTLLIYMGDKVGGSQLANLIAIDAFLVLSGAVLTSYVGVIGLFERMALDRILPPFFLKKNQRGSSYRIAILFLGLSISVLMIARGDVQLLAGVYSISFLSVMGLFAIGNMLLKTKRKKLPRPERTSGFWVTLSFIAVSAALLGNIFMPHKAGLPSNIVLFLLYFIPAILFISIMLNRTFLLKLLLKMIGAIFDPIRRLATYCDKKILKWIDQINSQEFVFFTKGEDLATLNKVLQYVINNEHTKKIKIATVFKSASDVTSSLDEEIIFLDREYPEIDIELVKEIGEFSPALIKSLSDKWKIPINFMFIASPSGKFPYRVEELGGVRLII